MFIYSHPDCLKHEMGPYHPECPARLSSIIQALHEQPWSSQLTWQEAPLASPENLCLVHTRDYVDAIFNMAPKAGYLQLDSDTVMNRFTLSAALHAAGALIAAVDDVFAEKTDKVFCAIRPPGHHAEIAKAMGFCFFNNIAIGAKYALEKYHVKRIAIVDFDVHHGNGTQSAFGHDPRVCFWSSFEHPLFPGVEVPSPYPSVHLCPLPAGTTGKVYRQKIETELIPLLEAFKPECIFISAGFDAHQADPLANLNFRSQDYGYITREMVLIAQKHSKGRIISTLEGGYNLNALSESVVEHVRAMVTPLTPISSLSQ